MWKPSADWTIILTLIEIFEEEINGAKEV